MTTQDPNLIAATTSDQPILEAVTEDPGATRVSHLEVIETVIASLQENDSAMISESDNGSLWRFQYGSVEVFVQLTGDSEDDLFVVWSPILSLPVKDELGLMRRLLEMNWTDTFEACFAIANDEVLVLVQRSVNELSPGEVARAITLVATVADENDEALIEEFNPG
ncbi:MAG: YbjN domain-containing protein [Chloroflexaceae bacterium]|nr:YbjN domain-containing protein [Chloroflexaceae bacterium]